MHLVRYGALALLVIASACSDSDPSSVDGGANGIDSGNPLIDASPNGPDANTSCNAVPSSSPSWIGGFQDDIVARLTGETAVTPGVFLSPDRASSNRRATTRTYLMAKLTELGLTAQQQTYSGGANPYAVLQASSTSSSNIVIGAHFDSVTNSPGANDNATGVAMVMAIARYLLTVDCRQSNFYFVFFDQEEIGLVGSFEYAQWLSSQSINVTSVHTIDQMGWDQDNDLAIELERPSGNLYAEWAQSKSAAGLSMTLHQTGTGSTDHVSFRNAGFSAIGITEEFVNGDTTPHYHLSSDTYSTVDFPYLLSTTVLANAHFGRLARLSSAQMVQHTPTRQWPANGFGHSQRAPVNAGCRHAYGR